MLQKRLLGLSLFVHLLLRSPATVSSQLEETKFEVPVSPSVYEDIADVRNDNISVRWMVAQYRNGNYLGPIDSYKKGEGGLDEVKACFEPENVMYALYRASYGDADTVRDNLVFITWIGTKVENLTKVRIFTHKRRVRQVFGQTNVTLYASYLSDITEKVIMDKVASPTGSRSQ